MHYIHCSGPSRIANYQAIHNIASTVYSVVSPIAKLKAKIL